MYKRQLDAIGVPDAGNLRFGQANISLSVSGLIAMLAVNRALNSVEESGQFLDALRGLKGIFASAPFIFDQASLAAAAPAFAEDRARLQERYGVLLPAPDPGLRDDLFFLTQPDFDRIEARFCPVGPQAEAVIAALRHHLRN